MGALQAAEMSKQADLDTALVWHLTSNHYPPLPLSILPCCKRAIAKAKKGQWDANIRLPKGVTWRGQTSAPVHACIEGWHLQAWLE
jgi:hypothetical protein